MFQIYSGIEKVYGYERVDIKSFRIVFFVSQCRKSSFRKGILRCSINFEYRKSSWIRGGGGGETRFFVENLSSQSAEKLRMDPFCAMFQKFLLAKNFMDERRESIKIFRRNFFYLTVPKIILGGNLLVSLCFWVWKGRAFD